MGLGDNNVRLIPPAYVKPFVKRQKNDAADAEAICETVSLSFQELRTVMWTEVMRHRSRG